MNGRALVWSLTAVTAVFAVATSVFAVADDGTRLPAAEGGAVDALGELMFTVMVLAFASLGALIATRRPRSPIGWILCASPFALAVSGLARGWYVRGFYADPGSQPPPDLLLWVGNWIWAFGFPPLITVLLLLLFPDGRLPSRRWRPVAWVAGATLALLVTGFAFEPGALDDFPRVENPFGAGGGLGEVIDALQAAGFGVFIFAAVGSAAALVARFRRSRGEERQQLRWMAAAAALVVGAWLANSLLDQAFGVNSAFFLPIVLLALPGASAVAVLRYRLYDLDLVVNRALVYGALTASLAATYLGTVLLVGLAVGRSGFAVAVSTLAVAGLFSARLRDEVDLDAVGTELSGAVRETVQPAHLTLWLRR